MTRKAIDPILREVFQHQLVGIAEEMSMALRRAAFSSIIWDMYDYACALFNAGGEMIAQAKSIPAQLGIMSSAFQGMIKTIALDDWRPGDVVMCNDPYRGCTHTPDIVLFSPVYRGDELVALTSTIAHHVDIGGKVPCTVAPDNLEVFAEGLIIPPLKLVEAGKTNQIIFDLITANTRNPTACLGDLRAQIAGCRTGERRVGELVRKYGAAQFRDLAADALNYTERYVRLVLGDMKPSRNTAEVLIEDGIAEEEPIRLVATVAVENSTISVDFAGTSLQRANALNCPFASTISMVHYAVRCLVASDLPQNDGCSRPVSVRVPLGTVLNPTRPAAVSTRHFTQQAVAEVVLKAMGPVFPERAAAGCQISFPSLRAGGFDDRPQRQTKTGEAPYYIIADILGGGMGGSPSTDGLDAVDTHGGNCALLSAEVMEMLSPFRVVRSELVPGSGGAGTHRGGLAIRRDYELLSEKAILGAYLQQIEDGTAPWGANGGSNGARASAVLNPGTPHERILASKTIGYGLRRGELLRLQSSGEADGVNPPDGIRTQWVETSIKVTWTSNHKHRRYAMRVMRAVTLALTAGFLLSGAAQAQTPVKGGTLAIGAQAPGQLNPAIQSGQATGIPGTQLFAGLVELDDKFRPHPYLAKSWTISKDELTYTFKLVEGATFHDGKPITSEDVAFSLKIVQQNHPFGIAMFGTLDRIETPDPQTVVLKLTKPHPALLTALSPLLMPVIPKHIYSTEPIRKHPANSAPVGSGPFKFVEFKPGEYLILARNERFFRPGLPYLDRVVFKFIKDPAVATLSLERGEIDYLPFAPVRVHDIARLERNPKIKVTRRGYEALGPTNYLEFNHRVAPLNDKRVRQAIAYALDKSFIVKALQIGLSRQLDGPFHHSSPFYDESALKKYPLDIDKANALLDEAGHKRGTDGIRFALTLDWLPDVHPDSQGTVSEYLRPQLRKIGIDIKPRRSPDFPTWLKRVANWEHELSLNAIWNYPDPVIGTHRAYLCSNQKKGVIWSNTEGYCNKRVDELLAMASVETNVEKRKVLYAEFQKILTDELPFVWTNEEPLHTVYSDLVGNVPMSVWGALQPMDKVYKIAR